MRYFKPRTDLEYSCILAPQKIVSGKQYRFIKANDFSLPSWRENYGPPFFDLLAKNFVEVKTEAEAVANFRG